MTMQGSRLQMADICLDFEKFLFDIFLMYEEQIRKVACLTIAINLDCMSDRHLFALI